ncbi:superoxide dismutase family protein [Steroidobacter denitrificans]|nr:superoxide dismutase family protein [Steroidobacter denitrificans]
MRHPLTLPARPATAAPSRAAAAGIALLVSLALVACKPGPGERPAGAAAADTQSASMNHDMDMMRSGESTLMPTASAHLAPTRGHQASGLLTLSQMPTGVHITGLIQNLPPTASFGFHIHEKGDCSAPDASSAGAHFNPGQQPHGDPAGDSHHAGDMLNLRSDDQGIAKIDIIVHSVSLHSGGATDVIGKAIVIHEDPDDYASQPSGNSGARIACGVIDIRTAPSDDPGQSADSDAGGIAAETRKR